MFEQRTYEAKSADPYYASWGGKPLLVCTQKVFALPADINFVFNAICACAIDIGAHRPRPKGVVMEYVVALNYQEGDNGRGEFYTREALQRAVLREVFTRHRNNPVRVHLGTHGVTRQRVQGIFHALQEGLQFEDAQEVTPEGLKPILLAKHPHEPYPSFSPRKVIKVEHAPA